MKEAEKEKQEGIQSQWQKESPAKEYLEQVNVLQGHGLHSQDDETGLFFALNNGEWEEYKASSKWKQQPRNVLSKEYVRPLRKWQKRRPED